MRFFSILYLILLAQFTVYADSTSLRAVDSVSQVNVSNTDTLIKKDTTNKEASIDLPDSRQRTQTTEVWVFIACCVTFFLAGLNRRINEKKHDQSVLGFLTINLLGQSTDRSFYEFNIHQLLGLIVHNLVIALWCFYFMNDTDYQFVTNNLLFFILLFFMVSIIYLCKFFFQFLALNILQINDLPVLLVKCNIGLGYFTFLISLPLFMIIYYVQFPEWHTILETFFIVLMSVYLAFRSFKYLQLFLQFFGTTIFYIILYFCALELIPLLVVIKISMGIF